MSKIHSLLIVALLTLMATPVRAVLKEKNIDRSLSVLRAELTHYHQELQQQSALMMEQQEKVRNELMDVFNKSQQNALMLYSQKDDYLFDLTYACHQATEQYRQFQYNATPFRKYISNANVEVARYDSLISDLSEMYVEGLSPKAKVDRNVCLTLAINIRHTLSDNRKQMERYVEVYAQTERRLKRLNDYANQRYRAIQASIMSNSGQTFFSTLSRIDYQLREAKQTFSEKYKLRSSVRSDWDGESILNLFGWLVLVAIVMYGINYGLIRWLFGWLVQNNRLPFIFTWLINKKAGSTPQEAFLLKRPYFVMAATVITMAICLAVIRLLWNQNFVIMASELLVEFVWLMGVILLSLLIRLNGDQIKAGFYIYLPLIVMGFVVIASRVVLIPGDLVNLMFPPVLLICALWQWGAVQRHRKSLPRTDKIYSTLSLLVFGLSVACSWAGYTLLAVQILIWWTMQLTCILTITCIHTLLKGYAQAESRLFLHQEAPISKAWLFRLLYHAVLPIMGSLSVLLSIYWAADVFNLSDTVWHLFSMRLIDSANLTLSIWSVVLVLSLYYVFAYIYRTTIDVIHTQLQEREQQRAIEEHRQADKEMATRRLAMWKNVIQVITWGAWVLVSMSIFHINNSWLVAISAGLSTGIGFAMKDILENIYYGLSLMAGRIRVGDFISIDGTRGTVKAISYVSTTVEATDGSVVTFQNAQLFTKNYKNLTKNHGNELAVVPVGVAYGSGVKHVRQTIEDAIKAVEQHNYIKYLNTVFTGLGDNSIDFKVLAWVDSRRMTYAVGDILEAIYNALNEQQIEIPFPQRDLHIIAPKNAEAQLTLTEEEAYQLIQKEQQQNKQGKA